MLFLIRKNKPQASGNVTRVDEHVRV